MDSFTFIAGIIVIFVVGFGGVALLAYLRYFNSNTTTVRHSKQGCPKCGATSFKNALGKGNQDFVASRVCEECGFRYTPTISPWMAIPSAAIGLMLWCASFYALYEFFFRDQISVPSRLPVTFTWWGHVVCLIGGGALLVLAFRVLRNWANRHDRRA